MSQTTRSWGPLLALSVLLLTFCEGDAGGPNLPEGRYTGEAVSFSVEGASVTKIALDLRCEQANDEPGATEPHRVSVELDLAFDVEVVGGSFSLNGNSGERIQYTVDGVVTADGVVSGTYVVESLDPPCRQEVSWSSIHATASAVDVAAAPDVWQDRRRDLRAFYPDDAKPDLGGAEYPPGVLPPEATVEQAKALDRVNWYRWRVGLGPIDMLQDINGVSQAHCDCYVAHRDDYFGPMAISPHDEKSSWGAPCQGVDVGKRMTAGGVSWQGASEVIAFTANPISAVDGWMATLYHRLPIIDPATLACGYGEHARSPMINTMNFTMALSSPDREAVVLYPEDGATGISPRWDGAESPQPIPPPTGYPSGPIITMTLGRGNYSVTAHSLTDTAGTAIEHVFADSGNDTHLRDSPETVCLYAHDPLEYDMTYHVRIDYTVGGEEQRSTSWSFQTRRKNPQ